MSENTSRLTVFFVLTLILLLPGQVCSESQIFLKDGRVLTVDNFWREEGMVKYETQSGIVGLAMADVERIVTPAMLAFEKARKLDTVRGYEAFLKTYGLSELADQARQRLKELEFQEVREMDTPSLYLNYIERNPNSAFLEVARDRAETLVYEDAVKRNDRKTYEAYLSLFPEGKHAALVMEAMEALQAESLKAGSSISDIEAFLKDNPDSKFQDDLEARIADLTAEAEAAAKKALEAQKRAQELAAAKAEVRRKRLIQFGGFGTFLALLAVAAVVFRNISARRKAAALLMAELDEELGIEGEDEAALYQTWAGGPVRYEDLIGVERSAESEALPGVPDAKGIGIESTAALPEPAKENHGESETDEGESISPFEEIRASGDDSVINLGAGESHSAPASGPEEVIDLSDHETDFKLELEDIPADEETQDEQPGENAGTREFDPEDLDFSGIFDGKVDETKRRRGGGRIADG